MATRHKDLIIWIRMDHLKLPLIAVVMTMFSKGHLLTVNSSSKHLTFFRCGSLISHFTQDLQEPLYNFGKSIVKSKSFPCCNCFEALCGIRDLPRTETLNSQSHTISQLHHHRSPLVDFQCPKSIQIDRQGAHGSLLLEALGSIFMGAACKTCSLAPDQRRQCSKSWSSCSRTINTDFDLENNGIWMHQDLSQLMGTSSQNMQIRQYVNQS